MKTIGVEKGLDNICRYLENEGYNVEEVDVAKKINISTDNLDAFIVTGMNDNVFGNDQTKTKIPLINADDLTLQFLFLYTHWMEKLSIACCTFLSIYHNFLY